MKRSETGQGPADPGFRDPDSEFRPGWAAEEIERSRTLMITAAAAGLAFLLGLSLPYMGYVQNWQPHRLFKIFGGIAAIAVVVARPGWMPYLLCLAFPYAAWLPKSPFPLLNASNLMVGGSLLGIALLTLRRKIHTPVPTSLNLPLLLFLGWMVFSGIYGSAIWPERSAIGEVRLKTQWGTLSGFLAFFVATHLLRTREQAWRALGFLIAGSVLGLLGPLREVAGDGWGTRTGGGIGEINLMGAYLAVMGVVTFCILSAQQGWKRWLLAVGALLQGIGLIMPNSRGAYVGFLVGALPQAVRTSVAGTLLLLVFLGSSTFWAPDFVRERITKTYEAASAEDAETALDRTSGGRITVWKAILPVIGQYPVFGVGYGNLREAVHISAGVYKAGHNLYLEVAGEMGLPGLALLVWLFVRCWKLGSLVSRRGGRSAVLGRSYHGAILCMLALNIFGQRLFDFSMAGMFCMLSGIVALEERFTRVPSSKEVA